MSKPTRTEPIITADNFNPATVYSVDTGTGVRGYGFVTRLSNDPDTFEELADTRRFFVFKPGGAYKIFTMTLDDAAKANPKAEWPKGETETAILSDWLGTHYVKPE